MPGSKGGTGVVNEGKTITLDGNLKIAGTGNVTLTNKGNTNITLPLSGKLLTDISYDTLQNKTLISPKLIGNPIAVTPDISSKDSSIATTGFVATLLGLDKTLLNLKID